MVFALYNFLINNRQIENAVACKMKQHVIQKAPVENVTV